MDQLNRQGLMVDAMVKTAALDDISSVNKQKYTKNIPAVRTIFGATVYYPYNYYMYIGDCGGNFLHLESVDYYDTIN